MNAIDRLMEYRNNIDSYLPLIDHETCYFPAFKLESYVNVGWNCGFIGNRPYFLECGACINNTMITIYLSAIGIEDSSIEDIEKILIDEGNVYSKNKGYTTPKMTPIFEDSNGNEFFAIDIDVEGEDELAKIELKERLCPYERLNELNELTGEEEEYGDEEYEEAYDEDEEYEDDEEYIFPYDEEDDPPKRDREGWKFCLKERQEGSAMLYAQDWNDFGRDDNSQRISVYRFDSENWNKLKETLYDENPIDSLFDKFYWIAERGNWFLADEFRRFCRAYKIDFEFQRIDCIWFQPEKETSGKMFEQLCMYEEQEGYKIPDEFPDRKYPQPEKGYWPIKVDMKNKVMTEVQGVTACAGYCSKYALMKYREIEGFYL